MELRRIADAIGIGEYPPEMEKVYASQKKNDAPACDLALIDSLQVEFDVFGEYYDLVREIAGTINADELRSMWIKTAVSYVMDKNVEQASKVPVPQPDGTAVSDLLALYILIPQMPVAVREYRRRGFNEKELQSLMWGYKRGIRIVEQQTGRPGVDSTYYWWLTIFAKAAIYETDGLQFELRNLNGAALYLRNRQTREVIPVMVTGTFHSSGIQRLGSRNYEDDTGAFDADFREDEENYYGHGVYNGRVDPQSKAFSKTQWECVARPGEQCLSIHIPRGADISPQTLDRALENAKHILKQRYPEYSAAVVFGSSWILDPTLATLLGENSNITHLQNRFARYPEKDSAMSVFGFVFPKNFEGYESLPENTSLLRKLKRLYIDGGGIYKYGGAILL